MTILEAVAALRAKKVSSLELTDQSLKRIAHANPRLNAFITVLEESARARASAMDAELAHGRDRGPLRTRRKSSESPLCKCGSWRSRS